MNTVGPHRSDCPHALTSHIFDGSKNGHFLHTIFPNRPSSKAKELVAGLSKVRFAANSGEFAWVVR